MEAYHESGGKKVWRLVCPIVTYYGISFIVSMIASIIITFQVMIDNMALLEAGDIWQLQSMAVEGLFKLTLELQAVTALLTIPVLIIYFNRDRKRRLERGYAELPADRTPLWMGFMVIFGAVAAYAGNGMITLSGLYEVSDGYDEVAGVFFQGKLWLELVCLGILTPIVEEFIFRGLLYRQLTELMDKKWAVALAAVVFGVFHGNLVQAIYGICLGLLMIYVYERFQTIIAPILFHMGANLLGVILSETTAFAFLYETAGAFYSTVVVASLMIIGSVWLIERRNAADELYESGSEN